MTTWPRRADRRERGALVAVLLLAAVLRFWNLDWDAGQHQHPDERFLAIVNDRLALPSTVGQYLDSDTSPLNPYNVSDSFVYGTLPTFLVKALGEWLDVDADGSTHATARPVIDVVDALGVPVRAGDGTLRFDGGYDSNLLGRALAALADLLTVAMVWAIGRRLGGARVGVVAAVLVATAPLHVQHAHFFVTDPFATTATTACLLASTAFLRPDGPRSPWRTAVLAGAAAGAALACKVSAVPVLAVPLLAIGLATPSRSGNTRDWWRALRTGGVVVAAAAVVFRLAQPYAFDGIVALDDRFVDDLRRLADLQQGSDYPPNVQWADRTRFVYPLRNLAVDGIGVPFAAAAVAGAVVAIRRARRGDLRLLLPLAWAAIAIASGARGFTATARYLLPAVPALGVLAGAAVVALWDRRRHHRDARRRIVAAIAAAVVATTAIAGVAYTAGVYGRTHSRVAATRWIDANVPDGAVLLTSEWDDGLPLRLPGIDPGRWRGVQFNHFGPDSRQKVEDLVATLDGADYVIETSNRVYDAVAQMPARYPSTIRYYDALFDGSLGFEEVARFTNDPSLFGVELRDEAAEEAFSVYDHPTVTIWERTERWSPSEALRLLGPDRADAALAVAPGDADRNALQLTDAERQRQQSGGTFADRFGGVRAASGGWAALRWFAWLEVLSLAALPVATWLGARLPSRGVALAKPIGVFGATSVAWALASWRLVDLGAGLAWTAAGAVVVVGAGVGYVRRAALAELARRHWRGWMVTEAVFVGVFALFLALRWLNPDVWHSARGGEKPMELAYLTALGRSSILPPVDPWIAGGFLNYYWLGWLVVALPMLALGVVPETAINLAVPSFAAIAAVVVLGVGYDLAGTGGAGRRGRVVTAGLAVVFLLGIGNLHTAWAAVRGRLGGSPFDWWAPSRTHAGCCDITEFPQWTFVFADLHPHLMAIPLVGASVGLALAHVAAGRAADRARTAAAAAGLGVLLAFVRAAHTWDVPTVGLVTLLAVVLGAGPARPWRHSLRRAATRLAIVAAVAVTLGWPHGRGPTTSGSELVWSPRTTSVTEHLVHFGLFTVVGLWFLTARLVEGRSERGAVGRLIRSPLDALAVAAVVVGALVAASADGLVVAAASAMTAALLLHAAWIDQRSRDGAPIGRTVATLLLALGFAIVAGVDVVTVAPDIERQNTVFKFYETAWQLLAAGSAFAVWHLARRHRRAVVCVVGLLVVASLAFPVLGIPARLRDRETEVSASLDGLAFARSGATTVADDAQVLELADDVRIVEWLRANVAGMPTIVEAVGPSYRWVGRISMLTGLPAVVGWDFHQRQQRGPVAPEVTARREEVTAFYRDADPVAAARFLRRYDVGYVIVGGAERAYGSPAGAATIAALPCTEVAFRSGRDVVYEVTAEACDPADPATAVYQMVDRGP